MELVSGYADCDAGEDERGALEPSEDDEERHDADEKREPEARDDANDADRVPLYVSAGGLALVALEALGRVAEGVELGLLLCGRAGAAGAGVAADGSGLVVDQRLVQNADEDGRDGD